ncbi:MAG: M6 family metalloprotease domain-containing protein, partial [Acidobacteria bacterium]
MAQASLRRLFSIWVALTTVPAVCAVLHAAPNLSPYQPSGWSDKIVLSTVTSTHSDSSGLLAGGPVYLDWAVINNGSSATASRFYVELYVDGALRQSWYSDPPLSPDYYGYYDDYSLGTLTAGSHTIRIRADSTNAILESDESDNEYTKTVYVAGGSNPNLTPYQPTGWSDRIVVSSATGTHSDSSSFAVTDTLYVDWAVINNGTAATGARFYTELFVDGVLRQTWQTEPPVAGGQFISASDFSIGTLSSGTHAIRLRTDSTGAINEGSETDNEYTKTITIGGGGPQIKRAVVLMVDFPDEPGVVPAQSFRDLLFAVQPGTPARGSLRDYYRETSYNHLDLLGDVNPGVSGWIRLPQTSTYYAGGCYGSGVGTSCPDYPQNVQKMAEDAVTAAVAAGMNFGPYDTDNNGYVDSLFIVHAGRGGEYSHDSNDIWSISWGTRTKVNTGSLNALGQTVYAFRFTAQPEFMNSAGDITIGVFAHEFGHNLGLPDLYDTDYDPVTQNYDANGVGVWSLMGAGSWNGATGDSPAHLDAWSKWRMGWLTPTLVTSTLTNEPISQAEANADVYQLLTGSALAGSGQYFLVENRQQVNFDSALPGAGLLIWHVDESQDDNSHQWYPGCGACDGRYKVALEQADGRWDLEHRTNKGDASDPYPGNCSAQPCSRSFDASTTPNSHLNSGEPSGVSITAIGNSSSVITATLSVGGAPCQPPQGPALSAPASANGGQAYTVSWTATSSENVYLLEEATSSSFAGAHSWVVDGTSKSFTHSGAGTYYYRVLARIHCSGAETDSVWSNVAQTQVSVATGDKLFLNGNRFSIQVNWRTADGHTGNGTPVQVSADSGYFWFFAAANVELFVKLLDGRGVNGHFWFFYGA